MRSILLMMTSVILLSCTKEYSCETNCRLSLPIVHDSTQTDTPKTATPDPYHYYSQSYHVSLAGTGNNAWGYALPQFDTAEGILDTLEIHMSTFLSSYVELSNNSNAATLCSINITRRDSLSADSMVLISHDYGSNFGPFAINGSATYNDTLNVMDNVQLTSFVTTRLDKFTGTGYTFFDYDPSSVASVMQSGFGIGSAFKDSTYIISTYHYKKKS